jgi:hypothetical protein
VVRQLQWFQRFRFSQRWWFWIWSGRFWQLHYGVRTISIMTVRQRFSVSMRHVIIVVHLKVNQRDVGTTFWALFAGPLPWPERYRASPFILVRRGEYSPISGRVSRRRAIHRNSGLQIADHTEVPAHITEAWLGRGGGSGQCATGPVPAGIWGSYVIIWEIPHVSRVRGLAYWPGSHGCMDKCHGNMIFAHCHVFADFVADMEGDMVVVFQEIRTLRNLTPRKRLDFTD